MGTPAQETVNHRLTHHDLEHTPDDGNYYEVIDGVLYVSPFPSYRHQNAASALMGILWAWVYKHELGRVFSAGLKVVLDEPTGVGPDVTYISAARMVNMREDGFYGAPDLVVEVLSTKPQLDRFVKFHKYAAAGIPHYWIIDTDKRTLEVFRLNGKRYDLVAELSRNATFAPELFPGLSIDLRDLWA